LRQGLLGDYQLELNYLAKSLIRHDNHAN
jgi:hypothetical protein